MRQGNINRCSRCVFRYVGMPKVKTKNKWGNICFKKDKYCQDVARSCKAESQGYHAKHVKPSELKELMALKGRKENGESNGR